MIVTRADLLQSETVDLRPVGMSDVLMQMFLQKKNRRSQKYLEDLAGGGELVVPGGTRTSFIRRRLVPSTWRWSTQPRRYVLLTDLGGRG